MKTILLPVVLLIAIAYYFLFCFGGRRADSIIADIEKVGIANLKREADQLFQLKRKDIRKDSHPPAMAGLKPVAIDLLHDGNIVRIKLEEFDGMTETGIYIYKNGDVPKRKYEWQQVDERVSIYKMWD